MLLTPEKLKALINEELTKADVRKIASEEIEKQLRSRKTKALIEDELLSLLGKRAGKDEVAEIAKKVLKRLYKDMAVNHPYMIDRIKV